MSLKSLGFAAGIERGQFEEPYLVVCLVNFRTRISFRLQTKSRAYLLFVPVGRRFVEMNELLSTVETIGGTWE